MKKENESYITITFEDGGIGIASKNVSAADFIRAALACIQGLHHEDGSLTTITTIQSLIARKIREVNDEEAKKSLKKSK